MEGTKTEFTINKTKLNVKTNKYNKYDDIKACELACYISLLLIELTHITIF